MAKEITFQKIAEELGVSKGLVSLAIRNKYGVSEETRSKIVLKAIEMGYDFPEKPVKNHKSITLLVKNMGILNEDFWRMCILGMESECANENVSFSILGWASLKDGENISLNVLNKKSQGVIILNQCQNSIVDEINRLNIPIVVVDMINPQESTVDQVMANNFKAGMQAVNHLLEKGHRDILMLGNVNYSFSFLQRYYGGMKAVKRAQERGEEVNLYSIIDCENPHLSDGAYQDDELELCNEKSLRNFLDGSTKVTAVLCFNESILRRLMKILQQKKISVPDQISVVSIDNMPYSEEHGITSIDIPKTELGIQAVRMLIERLDHKRENFISTELNTCLVERQSVKELNNEKN